MKVANYFPNVGIVRAGTLVIDSNGKMVQKRKMFAGPLSAEEFSMTLLSRKLSMYLGGSLFNGSNSPYLAAEKNFLNFGLYL
jgi:hypothetical protein